MRFSLPIRPFSRYGAPTPTRASISASIRPRQRARRAGQCLARTQWATTGLKPSAADVLRASTSRAAEHLGRDDIGMIAPGKLADLVLADGDPTSDSSALGHLAMVIADGRIVVDRVSP